MPLGPPGEWVPAAMISGTRDDTPEEEEEEDEGRRGTKGEMWVKQNQGSVIEDIIDEVRRRARGKRPRSIQGLLRHAAAALWLARHPSTVTHEPRRQVQTLVTLLVASCRRTSRHFSLESVSKTFFFPPLRPSREDLRRPAAKGRLSDWRLFTQGRDVELDAEERNVSEICLCVTD